MTEALALLARIEALMREQLTELRAMREQDDALARIRRSAADRQSRRRERVTQQSRESRENHATAAVVDLDPKQRDQEQDLKTAKSRDVTGPTRAAYASGYEARYGVGPVWNAKVNGQMSQVVQRLGAEEAPRVVAFYVRHNHAKYVGNRHPVGLLLQDCEGLRTQWATGKTTTATGIRQQDQTQANLDGWAEHMSEEGRNALVGK